jgi:diguanylate cyclase (GGDEF)-like protein
MALTDSLTGLLNRRHMGQRLRDEQARVQRGGSPFALIMADIDHFKQVNDTFGHDVGDRVLVGVGKLLIEQLRTQDSAARWGGEEFLLLLPDTNLQRAEEVANRLRDTAARQLAAMAGVPGPITITLGVSVVSTGVISEAAIKAADIALYEGKSAGRNCVVAHATAAPHSPNDSLSV